MLVHVHVKSLPVRALVLSSLTERVSTSSLQIYLKILMQLHLSRVLLFDLLIYCQEKRTMKQFICCNIYFCLGRTSSQPGKNYCNKYEYFFLQSKSNQKSYWLVLSVTLPDSWLQTSGILAKSICLPSNVETCLVDFILWRAHCPQVQFRKSLEEEKLHKPPVRQCSLRCGFYTVTFLSLMFSDSLCVIFSSWGKSRLFVCFHTVLCSSKKHVLP